MDDAAPGDHAATAVTDPTAHAHSAQLWDADSTADGGQDYRRQSGTFGILALDGRAGWFSIWWYQLKQMVS